MSIALSIISNENGRETAFIISGSRAEALDAYQVHPTEDNVHYLTPDNPLAARCVERAFLLMGEHWEQQDRSQEHPPTGPTPPKSLTEYY